MVEAAGIEPDSLYSNLLIILHKKIVRGHLEVKMFTRVEI
jgi:hypothetical protein